jgi:hypothetical protein
MAWLCLKDDAMKSKNMVIVTGPRLELSVDLIRRMKALFPTVSFESKETVIELNGCRIEAFPSHSARALRGIVDVKFILADESDFWNDNETDEVRSVLERMIPRSNPYIALVSTPNIPGGLMERIKNEPDDLCIYKRLYLPYTVGLGKIFRAEEIEQAKKLPSFDREFDLKFTGGIGDAHHLEDIDQAIRLGETMDPDVVLHDSQKCLGIDVGFGSSKTAMVLYQARDGKVQILSAKEYERPQQDDMIAIAADIYQRICNYSNLKIYVDGSNPGFIRELKAVVGDVVDYEWQIGQLRQKQKEDLICYYMHVIPINFSRDGVPMLQNARVLLEEGLVAIHPKFSELIIALKNAKATDDHLDKNFPFNDLYDAYRLAMWYVRPYHGEDEAANSGSVWALPTRRQQLEEYYRQRLVKDHNMRYLLDR